MARNSLSAAEREAREISFPFTYRGTDLVVTISVGMRRACVLGSPDVELKTTAEMAHAVRTYLHHAITGRDRAAKLNQVV